MDLQFSELISFCALIVSILSLILSYERTRVRGAKFCIEKAFLDKKINLLTGQWNITVKLRIINKGDRKGILDYHYRLVVYKKHRVIVRTQYGLGYRKVAKVIVKKSNKGTTEELDVGDSSLVEIPFSISNSDFEKYPLGKIFFNGEFKNWKNRYKNYEASIDFRLK